MHGDDGRRSQGSTLHVQVKSWSGARGGSNGCHCWRCAARATVLAVCCVFVFAVSAVVRAASSLPQRLNILCNPLSTATHHPHRIRTIISIHNHSCITSSVVTKTSIFLLPLPFCNRATRWALAACLARAQPLLLRKRVTGADGSAQ